MRRVLHSVVFVKQPLFPLLLPKDPRVFIVRFRSTTLSLFSLPHLSLWSFPFFYFLTRPRCTGVASRRLSILPRHLTRTTRFLLIRRTRSFVWYVRVIFQSFDEQATGISPDQARCSRRDSTSVSLYSIFFPHWNICMTRATTLLRCTWFCSLSRVARNLGIKGKSRLIRAGCSMAEKLDHTWFIFNLVRRKIQRFIY